MVRVGEPAALPGACAVVWPGLHFYTHLFAHTFQTQKYTAQACPAARCCRKKFALPNGSTVAVSAGLQHVGGGA